MHPPNTPFRPGLVPALLLLLLYGSGGCRFQERADPEGAPDGPAAEPWATEAYAPATDDGVRILIIHDMEGLSGQDDPSSFNFGSGLYPRAQEWLAADVNAVVDGLVAGGATEVLVADGHGSGNPEPDLRRDLLDERATQIVRDEPFDTYFDLPESLEGVDGVVVVGMHARTGSGGFASHTYTLGIDLMVHGRSITETELVALSWGRAGVPVVFASGDDRLAADLETMPWIEYVTVKEATAADHALPRPVEEARADLREGARRAVENLGSARVMRVSTPVRASLRAVPPASLDFLEGIPGLDYADGTLSFTVDGLRDAYEGLVATVGLARQGYDALLLETVREHPAGSEILAAYADARRERWYDQESGRYAPPESAAGEPAGEPGEPGLRRFHGYR